METRLITPTNSTIVIVEAANSVLQKLYRQGYRYKKAGVVVMGIMPNTPIQQDLFGMSAEQIGKMHRLDTVIDQLNKVNGTETIVLGCQQYTRKEGKGKADVFANAIKHEHRSKNPTTRWSDIITLKWVWEEVRIGVKLAFKLPIHFSFSNHIEPLHHFCLGSHLCCIIIPLLSNIMAFPFGVLCL